MYCSSINPESFTLSNVCWLLLMFLIYLAPPYCGDIHICTADNTCPKQIDCAVNERCIVKCISSYACKNSTINCPASNECEVHCNNPAAKQQCENIQINGQLSTFLLVNASIRDTVDKAMHFANIYCPSNGPFKSKQDIACHIICDGDDLMRFTHIWAVEGFNDVTIDSNSYTTEWCYRGGVMLCKQDFGANCPIDLNKPNLCAPFSTDHTCNDYTITVSPTPELTRHPTPEFTTTYTGDPTNRPTVNPTPYPTGGGGWNVPIYHETCDPAKYSFIYDFLHTSWIIYINVTLPFMAAVVKFSTCNQFTNFNTTMRLYDSLFGNLIEEYNDRCTDDFRGSELMAQHLNAGIYILHLGTDLYSAWRSSDYWVLAISCDMTLHPSIQPTIDPTIHPTMDPTIEPTTNPTFNPVVVGKIPGNETYFVFLAAVVLGCIFTLLIMCCLKHKYADVNGHCIQNALAAVITIGEYDNFSDDADIEQYLRSLPLEYDAAYLKELFDLLNYKLLPTETKLHWTQNEVIDFLQNDVGPELFDEHGELKYDALIICISCHGCENNIITSDLKAIENAAVHRIISSQYPKAREIPRLCVFDACQGTMERQKTYDRYLSTGGTETRKYYKISNIPVQQPWTSSTKNPDYKLIEIHSSNLGFQAKANEQFGSYFIYTFVEQLKNNINRSRKKSLCVILEEIQEDLHDDGKQQICFTFNNKTKDIWFKVHTEQSN